MDPLTNISLGKGTVFFFRGEAHGPFIHSKNQKSCFFSREVEKKIRPVFFFQEKFISHSFEIWRGPIYFLTNWAVFFSPGFLAFFLFVFFSGKVHYVIHSFDFKAVFYFFRAWKKKKTGFSFNQSILPKNVQKMNFAGKKNTVPLVENTSF